jgi:hypothetical protein
VISHGDEAAYAAAPNDFLNMAEEAFPAFDRSLWRPQIGFVEDEMQRLFVGSFRTAPRQKPP